jgi:hypothetical protein
MSDHSKCSHETFEEEYACSELVALRAQVEALKAEVEKVLKVCEWATGSYRETENCPVCWSEKDEAEHLDSCALAALLKKVKP